jgi:hypothetical protein
LWTNPIISSEAKRAVGSKGDEEVKRRIADAIAGCRAPNLHVKFYKCNLSAASRDVLMGAVARSTTLGGFSIYGGNDPEYFKIFRLAYTASCAPLTKHTSLMLPWVQEWQILRTDPELVARAREHFSKPQYQTALSATVAPVWASDSTSEWASTTSTPTSKPASVSELRYFMIGQGTPATVKRVIQMLKSFESGS